MYHRTASRRDQDDLHGDDRAAEPELRPVEPHIGGVGPEEDLGHPVQGQGSSCDLGKVIVLPSGLLPLLAEPTPILVAYKMYLWVYHNHTPKPYELNQKDCLKDQRAESPAAIGARSIKS